MTKKDDVMCCDYCCDGGKTEKYGSFDVHPECISNFENYLKRLGTSKFVQEILNEDKVEELSG